MENDPRFTLIFSKLHEVMEETKNHPQNAKIEIDQSHEPTRQELDELNDLRQIVLEVTEPEPVSFTTT